MHLSKVTIEGYKNFGQKFGIEFSKGLNVLVGENGVGKTAIIDAIRSLLPEDDYRNPVSESDFYRPFSKKPKLPADSFKIHGKFEGLSNTEKVAFLPWTDIEGNATLTLQADNKANKKGRYKYQLWGGASRSSMFETELFDEIDCVYLPPLRDAEAKLREGRSSRLARLFKNINKKSLKATINGEPNQTLEEKVTAFNDDLAKDDETIIEANALIKKRLNEAIGDVFGQDTYIQFSETNFNRIVESLRLFFFPDIEDDLPSSAFRSLEQNSLGYNNLLYIATVLAELTYAEDSGFYKILLIEEPEAHLHPQLQTRLLKHLEVTAKDVENNVQVVVTTHSPVLAASASVDSLIHLSRCKDAGEYTYTAIPLRLCGLADSSNFIERWLDATKSILLFAKGVILVEGIAEAMLIPELAKVVLAEYNIGKGKDGRLPNSLEDGGISVINMNGIYFKHFMPIFCNCKDVCKSNIPVRCSGLTDRDPPKYKDNATKTPYLPTEDNKADFAGNNPAISLANKVTKSKHVRLYVGELKTFEYDLAMEADNKEVMIDVLSQLWPNESDRSDGVRKTLAGYKDGTISSDNAVIASYILKHIENADVGKGLFAQTLADKLKPIKKQGGSVEFSVDFTVPDYIKKAIIWACGGNPDAD